MLTGALVTCFSKLLPSHCKARTFFCGGSCLAFLLCKVKDFWVLYFDISKKKICSGAQGCFWLCSVLCCGQSASALGWYDAQESKQGTLGSFWKLREGGLWTNIVCYGCTNQWLRKDAWLAAALFPNYLVLFSFKIAAWQFSAKAFEECQLLWGADSPLAQT